MSQLSRKVQSSDDSRHEADVTEVVNTANDVTVCAPRRRHYESQRVASCGNISTEVLLTRDSLKNIKMNRTGSTRSHSPRSENDDLEHLCSQNEESLTNVPEDHCIRCDLRVYPTEKVDVGVHLHRNCFRCKECGLMLSLNNFVLARVEELGEKDVFCKAHAPKPNKNRLDPEAIGIKMAVHSQQLNKTSSFNTQVRNKYNIIDLCND